MPARKGKWENATCGKQLDNVRTETHVVSVMIPRLETDAVGDKKDNRPLVHRKRRHRLTGRYLKKFRPQMGKLSGTRGKIPCRNILWGKCTYPSLPCVSITSLNQECKYDDKSRFRHVEGDGQPIKKSNKGGVKGSVASLKESILLGCVSQDSHPRKSILRKEGKLGSHHTVKFSNRTWYHTKTGERKIHREE